MCEKYNLIFKGFEGLPLITVIFTGSLQARIDSQGVPCKLYMGFEFAVQLKARRNISLPLLEILESFLSDGKKRVEINWPSYYDSRLAFYKP